MGYETMWRIRTRMDEARNQEIIKSLRNSYFVFVRKIWFWPIVSKYFDTNTVMPRKIGWNFSHIYDRLWSLSIHSRWPVLQSTWLLEQLTFRTIWRV